MKHLLLTTIAAVVLVGCGPSVDIHQAAKDGNIKAVKQHLDAGTDVNAKDKYGRTPLHEAAWSSHKEVGELLIAAGADVNAKGDGGKTPLHDVARKGHRETAKTLIAAGADVNAKDDGGRTPLDWDDGEVADLLRKHGGKHSTINTASIAGDTEAVKEFLATGVDVNANDEGGTPLFAAASRGHKEVAKLLIANGADVNVKNNKFRGSPFRQVGTPLFAAASRGHKEIVKLLISNGADVNAKNMYRRTALESAAFYGHKEIVELLIAEGADVNAKDNIGSTPLDMTSPNIGNINGRPEIAALLRKHGGKTSEELKAEGK